MGNDTAMKLAAVSQTWAKMSGHLSSSLILAISTCDLYYHLLNILIDFLRKSKGIHLRRKCHFASIKGRLISPDRNWENTHH